MNSNLKPELKGYCPVAYHALGEAHQGSSDFTSVHEGKLYYLLNEEAKREFESNPEKYLPAYGGHCAFGISIEKEFEACPMNFKLINGKTHLFLKNEETDALELWNNEDEEKCVTNADNHWNERKPSGSC